MRLDELQWEVNRLGAENEKLRDSNPEVSELLDRETELEGARREAARLTDRMRELERQLEEKTMAVSAAEQRAEQAEARAADNEVQGAANAREEELARAQRELGELDAKLEEQERRSLVAQEKAELERLRALEIERAKWEARELRLCTRLEAIEEELRSVKGTAVVTEHNGRLREGWQHLTERLEEADTLQESTGRRGLPTEGVSRPRIPTRQGTSLEEGWCGDTPPVGSHQWGSGDPAQLAGKESGASSLSPGGLLEQPEGQPRQTQSHVTWGDGVRSLQRGG